MPGGGAPRKRTKTKRPLPAMTAAFFITGADLTLDDLRSPVWRRFTQTLEERLQVLRELNDNPTNSDDKTALIRGQISEVKRLISLSAESEVADGSPFIGAVEMSHQ